MKSMKSQVVLILHPRQLNIEARYTAGYVVRHTVKEPQIRKRATPLCLKSNSWTTGCRQWTVACTSINVPFVLCSGRRDTATCEST